MFSSAVAHLCMHALLRLAIQVDIFSRPTHSDLLELFSTTAATSHSLTARVHNPGSYISFQHHELSLQLSIAADICPQPCTGAQLGPNSDAAAGATAGDNPPIPATRECPSITQYSLS